MQLAAGLRLGSYEIRALLGRGGAGEVYRAWDPRLEREVAIKILHERSDTDPDRLWRFVAEARAASALNHPNILTVFDAAVEGDTPYIVSELIEGASLRGELNRGAVALKRLLDLGAQISDGLAEAHHAGFVHRDMKPENIMVTPGGRAKILDFGLAGSTGVAGSSSASAGFAAETQTESGLLIGTVPYMSPEQARGSAVDARSDQFSLGLILYEMAVGAAPFRRDTPAQTLDAIINHDATPLPEINPQLPLMLWWIIDRCLAKDPAERYASTTDLHRDLRNLRDRLGDAVARERRAAPAEMPGSLRARRLLRGAAIAAVFIAGVSVWPLVVARRPAEAALRFTPFATQVEYEGLPVWSPDGQTIAYAAEKNGVLQIFTRTLSAAAPAQVTEAPYDCTYPFWSPDGKRIYYVSLARTRDGIWSVGAAGGSPQLVVENATRGAISPDGRTLAFLRDELRADIVGANALFLAQPTGTAPWPSEVVEAAATRYAGFGEIRFVEGALAFSTDGQSLGVMAVAANRTPGTMSDEEGRAWRLWVVPITSGGPPIPRLAWWPDPLPQISSFTWLPDNRHVLFGATAQSTPGSHLWMADLDRDRVWPLTQSADSESYPSASPDGARVVFTKGEPDYDVLELAASGSIVRTLLATVRKETDPAWSPDGSLVAYVTDREGQDEIWIRNSAGQPFDRPVITRGDFADAQNVLLAAPSFSPNGQRIAYLRTGAAPVQPLQIFTSAVAGSPPVRLLPATYHSYQGAPTWSPDGQWIAFAEWTGKQWTLVKVRVGSGELPVVLHAGGVPNATPHWSTTDEWITWETEAGFMLVSPDGRQQRRLDVDQWLAHGWTRDGSAVLGIVETEDLRLALVSLDVRTERTQQLADLGPSPPVNNPVQGFSVDRDGRILTSIARTRGDLWLMGGFSPPRSVWQQLISGFPIRTP